MRKIFIFICLIFSLCGMAQITIPMEVVGNSNYITAKIESRQIRFVFDTGATSIVLPYNEFLILKKTGKIIVEGATKVRVADGTAHDAYTYKIPDIDLGGIHINNVIATSIIGVNGPALFGMSAINKLGNYKLRNGYLTLQDYTNISFDTNWKASLLGCRFGIDTYAYCLKVLKNRFEEIDADDEALFNCKEIHITNVPIAGFDFSVFMTFYREKLSHASLLYSGWMVENAPVEGKEAMDEIYRFYKEKYKYSKENKDYYGNKYYTLGFTPACSDITIRLELEGKSVYTVIIEYYEDIAEKILNKGTDNKHRNDLDDI